MQEDLAGPAVAPVCELLDRQPDTDGDGVPAGQGGVEQLRPGVGGVAGDVGPAPQHQHAQAGAGGWQLTLMVIHVI